MIREFAELVPPKYVNDTSVDGYYRMLLATISFKSNIS